jgi:hypothetical protein
VQRYRLGFQTAKSFFKDFFQSEAAWILFDPARFLQATGSIATYSSFDRLTSKELLPPTFLPFSVQPRFRRWGCKDSGVCFKAPNLFFQSRDDDTTVVVCITPCGSEASLPAAHPINLLKNCSPLSGVQR